MSSAFTVLSELKFTTNGLTVVGDLLRAFERLDTVIGSAQANVARLTAEMRTIAGGARGINSTVTALEKIGKVQLAPGLLGEMDKVATATRELATLNAQMAKGAAETAAAYRSMATTAPRAAARAGGGGRATVPAGRAGGAARAPSHVGVMDVAIGGQMAGDAGKGIVEQVLMAQVEVRQQLAMLQMNTAISPADVARARAAAEQITKDTPGTKIAENLHHIVDLFTIFGDLNEAIAGAPAMARSAYVLANMPGQHHGDTSFAAAQAIELMQRVYDPTTHKMDPAAFNKQLAAITQVALGTGGRIDGSAYLAFAKQSRIGGMIGNDQFLYRDLPALLIALGGNRAGTGDAAVWAQLGGGTMTKNAYHELQRAGIIDKSAKWSGGRVHDMAKHLRGAAGFGANPIQWLRDEVLGPHGALAENHVDVNDKKAVADFLTKWASRQTGLGWLAEAILGMQNVNKEGGKIDTTTTNPLAVLQQNDPMQRVREFQAVWNSTMVAFGQNALGPAIEALRKLTEVINGLAEWGKAHPNAAADITLIAGGLSVLASGAGTAATALFIGGPLVMGMGGLARASLAFSAGAPAAVALAGLPGLLLALAGAAVLVPAMKGIADWLGWRNAAGAGRGGKGLQPPGEAHINPSGTTSGNYFLDWWNGQNAGPPASAGGRGGGKGLQQRQGSLMAPPGSNTTQMVQVDTSIMLDGSAIARVVSSHQARAMSGPTRGLTGYDPRMNFVG